MPESIYIQRQFMTFLGLEVYAEEIFFRVDDRDTDYVNTDMVLDRDRLLAVMRFCPGRCQSSAGGWIGYYPVNHRRCCPCRMRHFCA